MVAGLKSALIAYGAEAGLRLAKRHLPMIPRPNPKKNRNPKKRKPRHTSVSSGGSRGRGA
jgi:hypothetical protein